MDLIGLSYYLERERAERNYHDGYVLGKFSLLKQLVKHEIEQIDRRKHELRALNDLWQHYDELERTWRASSGFCIGEMR